jgi:hypothetical protein
MAAYRKKTKAAQPPAAQPSAPAPEALPATHLAVPIALAQQIVDYLAVLELPYASAQRRAELIAALQRVQTLTIQVEKNHAAPTENPGAIGA